MMTRQPLPRCGKRPDGASLLVELPRWPPSVDGAGFALVGNLTGSPVLCDYPMNSTNNSRGIIFLVIASHPPFRLRCQVSLALMEATAWMKMISIHPNGN